MSKVEPQAKCDQNLPPGQTSEGEARARAKVSILGIVHKPLRSLEKGYSQVKKDP